ncbi:MAG: AMP-binding protein [Dehalococcoidia bacterium]|nr:AMP-binding protein [Dehalococcoidia bacterium]
MPELTKTRKGNNGIEQHKLTAGSGKLDTLPKYLLSNYRQYAKSVTMRKKDFGIWNSYTWEDCYIAIKYFALALTSLGLKKGDKVVILGDNDLQWYWAELSAQCMGGAAVGVYIDCMPDEVKYIVENSDSVFVVAKDQEQVDKFLISYKDREGKEHAPIKEELPAIKKLIYWDEKGLWDYNDPWLLKWEDAIEIGKEYEKSNPTLFEDTILAGDTKDIAVICYTSGTTGLPKGVLVSHEYLVKGAEGARYTRDIELHEEYLSFIAPAWIAEQSGIAGWLANVANVNFPESPDTVMYDLREIGAASFMFGPPQWEGLLKMVQVRINDSSWIKRFVYNISLPVGYKVADMVMKRQKPNIFWRALYEVCNWICFRPVRDYLGLSHLKIGITAGALLGPDPLRWYRAIGVNLNQVYGLSEVNPVTLPLKNSVVVPETVSPLSVGVEVRISNDMEILARGPSQFTGYYKKEQETIEKVVQGWVMTGDGGMIEDHYGQLVIYDRLKDMIKLKDGTKYSPTYISNALKFSPYIKESVAIGDETKDYIFAIVVIDFESVGRWAEKNRIPYTTMTDLSQKKEVYELIEPDIIRVNKVLPKAAQMQKYLILYKEFDADEGELTRTRKVKRSFIEQRYANLVDAAYAGKEAVDTEAEVKYRDGTIRKITTTVNIRSV